MACYGNILLHCISTDQADLLKLFQKNKKQLNYSIIQSSTITKNCAQIKSEPLLNSKHTLEFWLIFGLKVKS